MFGIFFTPVFYSAEAFKKMETVINDVKLPLGSILEEMDKASSFCYLLTLPDTLLDRLRGIDLFCLAFIIGMIVFSYATEPYFAENIFNEICA